MIDRGFLWKGINLGLHNFDGWDRPKGTAEQPWDQFLKRVISWEPKVPPPRPPPPRNSWP